MPSNTTGTVSIILIEDNPEDASRIRRAFHEAGDASFRVQSVERVSTALARIAGGGIEVILLSLSTAGEDDPARLQNFRRLRDQAPQIPILILSLPRDEELAVGTIREGAEDYLIKWDASSDCVIRFVRSAVERHRNRFKQEYVAPEASRTVGKLIAFIGAKGGIGTTTTALNTAASLVRHGAVILVEVAPSRGILPHYFRQHGPPITLTDLPAERSALDAALATALREAPGISGLRALLAPRSGKAAPELSADSIRRLAEALGAIADYVIFDLSGASPEAACAVTRHCDLTALLVDRDPTCLSCAKWLLDLLQVSGTARDSIKAVVVNKNVPANSWPFPQIQRHLGQELIGVIPPALETCIGSYEARKPMVTASPDSLPAAAFEELANYFARAFEGRVPLVRLPGSSPSDSEVRSAFSL